MDVFTVIYDHLRKQKRQCKFDTVNYMKIKLKKRLNNSTSRIQTDHVILILFGTHIFPLNYIFVFL